MAPSVPLPDDIPITARLVWLRSLATALVAVLIIQVGTRLTGIYYSHMESVDLASWGAVLLATGGIFLIVLTPQGRSWWARGTFPLPLALAVFIAYVIAVAWIEPYLSPFPGDLWSGFGTGVLLGTLILMPIAYRLLRDPEPRIIKLIFLCSLAISLVIYLPSLIQTPWVVIDPYHSALIVNELLGPFYGHYGLATEVPQYTSLLGLPLVPVLALIPHPLAVTFAYLSLLSIATIVGVVAIAFKTLPKHLRYLSLLLTVPLILVKVQPQPTYKGSIAALHSALPVRTLPVVVVGLLLIWSARRADKRSIVIVGAAAGAAALNNFEFGVPALIAALLVCCLRTPGKFARLLRVGALFAAGALIPVVSYISLLLGLGQPIELRAWTAFVLAFGSGAASMPMPLVGTHLLVVMLLVAGGITGIFVLRRLSRISSEFGPPEVGRLTAAASTSAFFGLAGLGSFGYYIGRSVTSGQLQIFLLFLAPIICAQLSLVRTLGNSRRDSLSAIAASAILLLPACLATASVLQAPDARFEWSRIALISRGPSPFVERAKVIAAELPAAKALAGGRPLVGAVSSGTIIEALIGLPDYSPIDQPEDTAMSPLLARLYCSRLENAPGPIYAEVFSSATEAPRCAGFRILGQLPSGAAVVERIKP